MGVERAAGNLTSVNIGRELLHFPVGTKTDACDRRPRRKEFADLATIRAGSFGGLREDPNGVW
jgi:hypothetical protein